MSDEAPSDEIRQARALLRVLRLRRFIWIGTCAVAVLVFVLAGGELMHWWPVRAWMIATLLIPTMLGLLAFYSLKAPESVRERLWVRRVVLIVWRLLALGLFAWGVSDVIGYGPGLTGGLSGGIGVLIVDAIREWPRTPDGRSSEEGHHHD